MDLQGVLFASYKKFVKCQTGVTVKKSNPVSTFYPGNNDWGVATFLRE